MMLLLWTPNGPPVFELDETWCFTYEDIGGPCDSGFWDVPALQGAGYPEEASYALPLEVDPWDEVPGGLRP